MDIKTPLPGMFINETADAIANWKCDANSRLDKSLSFQKYQRFEKKLP